MIRNPKNPPAKNSLAKNSPAKNSLACQPQNAKASTLPGRVPIQMAPRVPASPLRCQQKATVPRPAQIVRPTVQPKVNVRKPSPPNMTVKAQPVPGTRTPGPPLRSSIVQAVKFYPNLHPGAVEPVNPANIFRLNSVADQYRLHRQHNHSVNVPNQQYNFVRTREGEMLLHNRYRHPSIAEGKQVLYAGEVYFNNGKLEWWSNGSGHYQPGADDAEQASLPMDRFFSYQEIIKGEHTRKKGKR